MVLATLAAQSLTHQALMASNVEIANSPQTKQTGDLVVPNSAKELTTKQAKLQSASSAIALPEFLAAQEFSAPESATKQATRKPEPMAIALAESLTPKAVSASGSLSVVPTTVATSTPQSTSTSIAPPEIAPLEIATTLRSNVEVDAKTREYENTKKSQINASPQVAQVNRSSNEQTQARASAPKNGSMSVESSVAPQVASVKTIAELQNHSARDLQQVSTPKPSTDNLNTPTSPEIASSQQTTVAQAVPTSTKPCLEVDGLQTQLHALEDIKDVGFQASPALSIVIPTGFGADNNTGFISGTFQQRTRYGNVSDGALGFGVGLGDARKSVGVELSYTMASFGGSRDFGAGGFNVKVHRQLPNDFAVAVGWNGFLNVGGRNDFENSVYGAVTKVFRTREDINSPFSRVAVTAGIGSGQFRTEDAVANNSGGVNVFGNVAVRVAQPVSLIAEWSGQDLGLGLSIAPFKNFPLVITPAVRDIAGAGDGPRFVLGTGLAFKF